MNGKLEIFPVEEDGFVEYSALLGVAVYALLSRGKVVYIGQSTQPLLRLFQHRLKAGERIGKRSAKGVERFAFDQIYILPCTLARVNYVEREMIAKHQPKYNLLHRFEKIDMKALVRSILPTAPQANPYMVGKLERRV